MFFCTLFYPYLMSSIETSECEEIHFNILTLWAQKKTHSSNFCIKGFI